MTLPDPFFQFDGTAGRYLKKEDVNLLDADTAHIQQSIGEWVSYSLAGSIAQSTDLTPIFGTSHLGWIVSAGNQTGVMVGGVGVAAIPVSPSTDYAFEVTVAVDQSSWEARVGFAEYDGGGVQVSITFSGYQDLTADQWLALTYAKESHASAAYIAPIVWLRPKSGPSTGGEKAYLDAAIFAADTAAVFVPSLRIVGDLDLRADVNPLGSATIQHFVAHWQASTQASSAYRLYISGAGPGNGTLWVVWRDSVGTAYNFSASAVVAFGTRATYRTTLTAAGAYELFVNGVSVASGSSGIGNPLNQATSILECGSRLIGTNGLFGGDMYSAEVRDGIDGPVVARFDPDDRLGL